MRKKLEFQADRIETVLSLHKVLARVTGGTVTPRWVRFQVLPAMGAKISKIKGLSEELAAALDAPSCRVSRRGAAVAIEVPRDDPQPVRLLPLLRQLNGNIPAVTATLGLAEDGSPLLIRLSSPNVGHILVTGMPGAGKTTLLQTMVLSLATTNDPGDLGFLFLGDGLPEVAHAVDRAGFSTHRIERLDIAILCAAIHTVGKRVIIIGDDVRGNGKRTAARLARLMKPNNRHYILVWDGIPPAEVVTLFKARMVGKVASATDARVASGRNGTGAEQLQGKGDFLAVAEGEVIHFQAAQGETEVTAVHAVNAQGQEVELFAPRGHPEPWTLATTASEGEITTATCLTKSID